MSIPRRPEPIPTWEATFPERLAQALAAAHRLSEDELTALDGDAVIEAVLTHHAASPVVPRFDLKWNKMYENNALGFDTSSAAHPAHFELNVPCEGAGYVLFNVPGRLMNGGGTTDPLLRSKQVDYPAWQISLRLNLAAGGEEMWLEFESALRNAWDQIEASLTEAAKTVNQMIEEHRAEVSNSDFPGHQIPASADHRSSQRCGQLVHPTRTGGHDDSRGTARAQAPDT